MTDVRQPLPNPTQSQSGPPPQPPPFPFAVMFMVWVLIVLVSTVVTLVLPEWFAGAARIRIEHDQSDIQGLSGGPSWTGTYDPYFIQTELEVINSDLILSNVVAQLDLNHRWAKVNGGEAMKTEDCVRRLKGMMALRPIRNTSIVEINFKSEKPEEAANLANQVADSYRDFRLNERSRMTEGGIKALSEEYRLLEQKTRVARAKVADLQQQLEITESSAPESTPEPRKQTGTVAPAGRTKADQNSAYLEAKQDLDEAQRFQQMLEVKILSEQVETRLPKTSMVRLVDTAKPILKAVYPNKPLNISMGIIVGGLAGLVLSGLVFWLQRRAYRRSLGSQDATHFSSRLRLLVHVGVALFEGLVIGYSCAQPLAPGTFLFVPLALIAGGCVSAYIELARPTPCPPPQGRLRRNLD